MQTFVDLCLSGHEKPENITLYTKKWHKSNIRTSLFLYLGFTAIEWGFYLTDRLPLPELIRNHCPNCRGRGYEYIPSDESGIEVYVEPCICSRVLGHKNPEFIVLYQDINSWAKRLQNGVGPWLSAALSENQVCLDFKEAINDFFKIIEEMAPGAFISKGDEECTEKE